MSRSANLHKPCELCGQMVTTNGLGRASHYRACIKQKLTEIREARVRRRERHRFGADAKCDAKSRT